MTARARPPDLGDLVVVLLAGSLAGLRDRLAADGFVAAAELVADVVDIIDDFVARLEPCRSPPRRKSTKSS